MIEVFFDEALTVSLRCTRDEYALHHLLQSGFFMTFNYYSSAREPCLALTAERETCVDLSSQKIHEVLRIEELLSQAQQRIAVSLSIYCKGESYEKSSAKKEEFLLWLLGEKNLQSFKQAQCNISTMQQERETRVRERLARSVAY